MIKAIIFDYFGVISSDKYWNLVKADPNIQSEFRDLSNAVNMGDLEWGDFLQIVARKTNKTADELLALYEKQGVDLDLLAIIKKLHGKYKTGLLTNANHDFMDSIVKQLGLEELFDSIVISSRVGAIKPMPQIYEIALKELNVKAVDTVFIDDKDSNCQAAQNLGLQAITYKNSNEFLSQLEKILNEKV